MTNKTIYALGVFFAAGGGISGAYAADGTLHVTGDVTTSTCVVDVAGTTHQFGTISLNSISKSNVSTGAAGVANPGKRLRKDFYIAFSNCPASQAYTLDLTGPKETWYSTFESQGAGNPELVVLLKDSTTDAYTQYVAPVQYEVGADSHSPLMDVNLYRQDISTLTFGDLQYQVDYTITFE